MNLSLTFSETLNYSRINNDFIWSIKGLMAKDDNINYTFLAPQNINDCLYIPYQIDDTVQWRMFYKEKNSQPIHVTSSTLNAKINQNF